jgi:hypothetical protein
MPIGHGAKCPFLSYTDDTGFPVDRDCIRESCVFWDQTGWLDDGEGNDIYCRLLVDQILTETRDAVEDTYLTVAHLHKQHHHQRPHHAVDEGLDGGMTFVPNFQPSTYLMQEFFSGVDCDGNGKIYGVDFGIERNDRPPMLDSVESGSNFKSPRTKISYSDYSAFLRWGWPELEE